MYKPEMNHVTCTKAEYDTLKSKPASTLYFCYDTSQIFKGSQEFCPADGSGDKLPEVTTEDNGDVLTVINGAWDKAEAQGGNNDFIVTYTDNDGTITADKTFNEITAAYQAGKNIKAISNDGDIFLCMSVYESEIAFITTSITGENADLSVEQILHLFNNKIIRSDYNSNPN